MPPWFFQRRSIVLIMILGVGLSIMASAATVFGLPAWAMLVIGVLVTVLYITGLPQDTRSTPQTLESSDDKISDRDNGLAMIGHDLMTPATGILGAIDSLSRTSLDEEQTALLKVAKDSTNNMVDLVNDMVELVRLDSGRIEAKAAPFLPMDIIMRVAGMMAPRARESGLTLSCIASPPAAAAHIGDAARIQRILINLVSNAIKFTDIGGVTMSIAQDAHGLSISVSDTGIGIPEDATSKLGQRYFRVGAAGHIERPGSGLGLAICYELAALIGARISVASESGRGSQFVLTVPGEERTHDAATTLSWPQDRPRPNVFILSSSATAALAWAQQCRAWDLTAHIVPPGAARSAIGQRRYSRLAGESVWVVEEALISTLLTDASIKRTIIVRQPGNAWLTPRPARHGFREVLIDPVDPFELKRALTQGTKELHDGQLDKQTVDHKIRILLVEDNRINQALISNSLREAGFDVTIAGNGETALAHATAEIWDLVLMDVRLPDGDGRAFTQKVLNLPGQHGSAPIVGMSADAEADDIDSYSAAGMAGFVAKPVDHDLLVETVRKLARNSKG